MADYCQLSDLKSYLGDAAAFTTPFAGDALLSSFITSCSRMFDRETARPTGFWAAQTGVTRRYSGSGTQWLALDDWDAITAVTVSTKQDRSDAAAIALPVNGVPQAPDYAEIYPLTGPPFDQLFMLRSWFPDTYAVGNVAVTGNTILQPEIAFAVTVWAAYLWRARESGWSDETGRADGSNAPKYSGGIPEQTQIVIDYYMAEETDVMMPLNPPTQSPRLSPVGADARLIIPDLLGNS
jgi:hypothetical protein